MLKIIAPILVSFIITVLLAPKYMRFIARAGLVGTDVQKKDRRKIPEMGGPIVMIGFLAAMFLYIWTKVFIYNDTYNLITAFAAVTTIIIITMIGLFDDLTSLFKKMSGFKRIGLKQWQKPLLTIPAAVPLMAIMVGNTTMMFPFVGEVNLGIIYPLLLIPIAIVGASNAINMLAGMNGLEAGLGVTLISGLSAYAYINQEFTAAIVGFSVIGALLGFLVFNWYPAKIMPGDSLPYMIGATAAILAIIGNMEKFAAIIFLPWFIELILKARTKFKAENFGQLQKDGTLKAPYKKSYSMTHVVMKMGRFKEWQVVSILITFEIVIIVAAFFLIGAKII